MNRTTIWCEVLMDKKLPVLCKIHYKSSMDITKIVKSVDIRMKKLKGINQVMNTL